MSSMHLTRWVLVGLACLVSSGCATSGAVEEAPLESSRQQKLRQSLVGTWMQTHVVDDGDRKPVDSSRKSWTFQKGGTGVHRSGPEGESNAKRPFRWRLEGRNLVIDFEEGGEIYFRAEAWSALQMKWYRYKRDVYYVLRPSGDSIDKAPGTRMGPAGRDGRRRGVEPE
jgi:hypothetical protein